MKASRLWSYTLTALTTLGLAALPAPVSAEVNWRAYAGQTIFGIIFADPDAEAYIRPETKRFTEKTGINVRMEVLDASKARTKVDILLSGKDSSLDFHMEQMDQKGAKLTAAGQLESLEPYLNDPSLTPADYNYPGDWAGGCLNAERVVAGQPLNNIVYSAQAQLLFIRKDLFKKYNVKVPATMEELEAAAKALTIDEDGDGTPDIYGFLAIPTGGPATAPFGTYLWNFGGSWFKRDASGKKVSNVNSKESVDAFEFYGRLVRKYGPKAALTNGELENNSLFAAGKVAMLSSLNYAAGLFEDPARSRIVGKSEVIMVPRGPAGSFPNLPAKSLFLSPYSKKKNVAWLYIMYLTQKETLQRGQNQGVPTCRKSVWTDPSFKPITETWKVSAQLALRYGVPLAKPISIAVSEMRAAAGAVADVAVRNGDRAAIQAEADKQAAIMTKLVEETEKGLNFRDVFREGAERMPESAQLEPIRAIRP
ncbi:MAG: extracellular solute-binding protein [Candidatus Rokubacteria bacterium]|nr:extracellular solute-binding protein [Candidatus Rokubacteria bacterium]